MNSSLNEIIEVADFITESHTSNPDLMCINCITELAKERKLYVDFIAFEEDTTLVMILENRTMEQPYVFEFLNKYTGDELISMNLFGLQPEFFSFLENDFNSFLDGHKAPYPWYFFSHLSL